MKYLILFVLMIFSVAAYGQNPDLIVTTTGDSLICKIVEVSANTIQFRFDTGTIISIRRTEVTSYQYNYTPEKRVPDRGPEIPAQVIQTPAQFAEISEKVTGDDERSKDLHSYGFFGYAGDTKSLAGITFGTFTHQKVGWYFTARMTPRFVYPFLVSEKYFLDESGIIMSKNDEIVTNAILDDVSYLINMNAALGITRIIYNPLWFYAGGGITWDNHIRSFRKGFSNSDDSCAQYTEQSKAGFMLDYGLSVKLSGVVFSGGMRINSFKSINFTFGFQFAFKNGQNQ